MKKRLFDDEEDAFLARGGEDESPHIDFTPMIDCVVLLLGFFMVTSNLGGRTEVDVPPAKHGTSTPTESSTIVTVRAPATSDASPAVYLGEGTRRPGDLGDGEEGVKRYVETGLQKNLRHVIVKADRDVPFGFVQDVIRSVNSVEGVTFSIGVRERKQ